MKGNESLDRMEHEGISEVICYQVWQLSPNYSWSFSFIGFPFLLKQLIERHGSCLRKQKSDH